MTTRAQMLCAYSRMSLAALVFAVVGGDDCGCGVADDDHRRRLKTIAAGCLLTFDRWRNANGDDDNHLNTTGSG